MSLKKNGIKCRNVNIYIEKTIFFITGHEKDYIISNNLPFHSACYLLEIYGDNKLCYITASWSSRRKRILRGNLPVSLNAIPAYPKATQTYANKMEHYLSFAIVMIYLNDKETNISIRYLAD